MNVRLPNFLIVGAAKAGTSSLYYYLIEHPEIYLPQERKELRFFSSMKGAFKGPGDEQVNNRIIKTLQEYSKFFVDVSKEKAVGDISPDYLYYYSIAIENIKKILNNPKIIIVLRNPVERSFSQYLHFVRDGRESLSFEDAISKEHERKKSNWEWAWRYTEVSFYYKQVKAYIDNFSQTKIILYEDYRDNSLNVLQDIYSFLNVTETFQPSCINKKFNVSGVPKNNLLHNFLTRSNPVKSVIRPFVKALLPADTKRKIQSRLIQMNLEKPQMKPETRKYLINLFREDILKLQDLIKRDLSHWLE